MKLQEINNELMWQNELTILRNQCNEKYEIWEYVVKHFLDSDNKVFKNTQAYMSFLFSFYKKLKFTDFTIIRKKQFYNYCVSNNLFDNDNDLFFFVAKNYFQINFNYFINIIENNKYLVSDIKTLNEKMFQTYDLFWTCLYKQENIPINFINKYFYYFYKNKEYFYSKLATHKSFFALDQVLINKFKNKNI